MQLINPTLATSIFDYFFQSNFAGQCIIIALAAFSLIAWTLMIGKYLELKRYNVLNGLLSEKVNQTPYLRNFDPYSASIPECPFSELVSTSQTVTTRAQIESALSRDISRLAAQYESKMTILSSIISGAPFLGLLGTVWGVMDSFGNVALQHSASIQTLAPGVSGALLTTVAALLVAIPSVFGYNFLVAKLKGMIIDLENFAGQVADRIESEL